MSLVVIQAFQKIPNDGSNLVSGLCIIQAKIDEFLRDNQARFSSAPTFSCCKPQRRSIIMLVIDAPLGSCIVSIQIFMAGVTVWDS